MSTFSRFVLIGAVAMCAGSAGAQEIQRVLGVPNAERLQDIRPVVDQNGVWDGYIAAGWRDFIESTGQTNRDYWVVRLRTDGAPIWNVRFGGSGRDEAFSVTQTPDLGFAVVGEQTSTPQPLGLGLVKLDAAGNFQWARALSGGGFTDNVLAVVQRSAGVSIRNVRGDQLGIVSYWRQLGAATQLAVFYRVDLTGAIISSRAYADAQGDPSRLALADLRESPSNADLLLVGTRARFFTALPGGSDLDPIAMRVDPLGNPLAAAWYDTSLSPNQPDQETGEGVELPVGTAAQGDAIFYGYGRWTTPLGQAITGTHAQRINSAVLATTWRSRFARFIPALAAIDQARPGAGVVIPGGFPAFTGVTNSPAMLRVDDAGAISWGRAYRGVLATAPLVGEATGVTINPVSTLGFGLSGFLTSPAVFGSEEGLFLRTNSFGLTGCPEVALDIREDRSDNPPRDLPLLITFPAATLWPAEHRFVGVQTVFCAGTGCCNVADITSIGGSGPPCDGQLTVDDTILFVNEFSAGTGCPGPAPCNISDITGIGGPPELPDGQLTVDDIIAFVNAFSDGCP